MIANRRKQNLLRNVALAVSIVTGAIAMSQPSAAQSQVPPPAVTGVLVILTVKAGVAREQIMAVMPTEVRQTVQLYLKGKIQAWYSRGDGRGAIFLLNTKDVAEAHAIMEALPLAEQKLMDHDYIPVGPLLPLGLLTANP